jgi:hypothetical protein
MMEPWFDPNHYAWIPGSAYGVTAGLFGGLVARLASRGHAKNLVLGAWIALWAVAIVLLGIGVVALIQGQPWGVWYGFLLPGSIGTLVVGANSFVVLRSYKTSEERRLAAKDLF